MIIAFDMDGVLADLVTPWLAWINETYGDNLTYEALGMYKISQQATCGKAANDFLFMPDTYEKVQPIHEMLAQYRAIQESGRAKVIVATKAAHNGNMVNGKIAWFKRHAPFIKPEDVVFAQDKSLVRADVLIDDDPRNLETFPGFRVLVSHPYNRAYEVPEGPWAVLGDPAHLPGILNGITK